MPILVVDDEAQVRCLLKRILVRHGFTVIEANDGPSALRKVRELKGHIAGLPTDNEMVGMSGIELANRVASEFPKVGILFISSAAEEPTRQTMRWIMPAPARPGLACGYSKNVMSAPG